MKIVEREIGHFKRLLKDQKGQVDIIGNIISILEKQPWILLLVFLAAIYATTFHFTIFGVEFGISSILTGLLSPVFGVFNFGFDWRLIVIISFFSIPVWFIFKYGYK